MSNYDPNAQAYGGYGYGQTAAYSQAQIDQGLRSYMVGVYNYMMIGLAITGLAALGIYMLSVTGDASLAARGARGGALAVSAGQFLTPFGAFLFTSWFKFVVILAPLGVVMLLSFRADRMSAPAAQMTFWLYAALVGVSMTTILLVYAHTSVARVFFITAASFGALSLYGYTTKRDLSGMGTFLMMGLFGLIIASLVNIGIAAFTGQASTMLQWIISVVGVLIFAGLTAYDTQNIKNEYIYSLSYASDGSIIQKAAIFGALQLYMDFVGMFQFLMSLLGSRNE
ncbi:Bax inhibitor-1/YccA family protein [Phreatobacter aquaticus]|uniref:Bax inhibitor-1/YccA family protein n=1 Tax=Phreatobacter aquaticus TaxID=2570229 RepID=A0A4D7QGY5_9HYPH|nr:Bax inhibitor-1/YccA family protein [Phreatobacter aquaticus]QCK84943.1 Bax inhibitor-1/YccA family protein [Phreatobacter aquaticus]